MTFWAPTNLVFGAEIAHRYSFFEWYTSWCLQLTQAKLLQWSFTTFERLSTPAVWHVGLLQKLSDAGIDGSLYRWFTDYIRSHQQFVTAWVGCSHSSHGTPLAWVPQGSVLGPTLFILYINFITSATKLPSNSFSSPSAPAHEFSLSRRFGQDCPVLFQGTFEKLTWPSKNPKNHSF